MGNYFKRCKDFSFSRDFVTLPGLPNLGNTCYVNSVIQVLYALQEFSDFMIANSVLFRQNRCKMSFDISYLFECFTQSQSEIPKALQAILEDACEKEIITKGFQDNAATFCINLINCIEDEISPFGLTIKDFFYGEQEYQYICNICKNEVISTSDFSMGSEIFLDWYYEIEAISFERTRVIENSPQIEKFIVHRLAELRSVVQERLLENQEITRLIILDKNFKICQNFEHGQLALLVKSGQVLVVVKSKTGREIICINSQGLSNDDIKDALCSYFHESLFKIYEDHYNESQITDVIGREIFYIQIDTSGSMNSHSIPSKVQKHSNYASTKTVSVKMQCSVCNSLENFTYATRIVRLPKFFLMSVNKKNIFQNREDRDEFVKSGMKIVIDVKNSQFELKVQGFISHYGTIQAGHYVSCVEKKGFWYMYNDQVVTKLTEDQLRFANSVFFALVS